MTHGDGDAVPLGEQMVMLRRLAVTLSLSLAVGLSSSCCKSSPGQPETGRGESKNAENEAAKSGNTLSAQKAQENGESEWGTLTGRFVARGEVVDLPAVAFPVGHPPVVDESLVVDDETRGISNIVVWLDEGFSKALPIHPSYERSPRDVVELSATSVRFSPRVTPLRVGQPLVLRNVDTVGSGFTIDSRPPVAIVLHAGQSHEHVIETPHRLPLPVVSGIHPWKRAWIMPLNHPYVAVTDSDGSFEIENIPTGKRVFRFWHERLGFLSEFRRIAVTIESGRNDFGVVQLDVDQLLE